MSIQAVKGVEIGDGFEVAGRRGSEAHDPIVWTPADGYRRTSAARRRCRRRHDHRRADRGAAAMKPLATLNRPTLAPSTRSPRRRRVSFKERTDVTAVPALGVVAETMVALVLADEVTRKFGGDSIGELVRNAEPSPLASRDGPVG